MRAIGPWRHYALAAALALVASCVTGATPSQTPLLFGITPVFLVDQASFLDGWNRYLSERLQRPVRFVRRKTYAEITDLLQNGELDAAWICSFSYVFHRTSLRLVATPVFRGEPYYESYLIVPAADTATQGYTDLADKVFAYVEPRSNTGYLYPRYAIQQLGEDPNGYFRDTFFIWSHPDSVHAVAERVADAAAVDSYIWESLRLSDPALTERTRVVSRSKQFGFPPVVAGVLLGESERQALADVILTMHEDAEGRRLLGLLHLDRFIPPRDEIYDGIPAMIEALLPLSE
jgi:phosphonate transport system substrate-binding protein